MIVKILGILDIIAAILFWIGGMFHIIPANMLLIVGFYLLVKGAVFLIFKDIASILDIVCSAVVFLAVSFSIPLIIVIIVSLFLLQKGIFSLLA